MDSITRYGGFLKQGYPKINPPAIEVPPFVETRLQPLDFLSANQQIDTVQVLLKTLQSTRAQIHQGLCDVRRQISQVSSEIWSVFFFFGRWSIKQLITNL